MHISYALGLVAVTYASQAAAFGDDGSADLAHLESVVPDVDTFCVDRLDSEEDSAVDGLDAAAVDRACELVLSDETSDLERREADPAPKKTTKKGKKRTTKKGKKVTKKAKTPAKKATKKTTCNTKYIKAIKKAHPKNAVAFCKKYKPSPRSNKSSVKGVPNAKSLSAACKCVVNAAKKTSTKKKTTKKTTKKTVAKTSSSTTVVNTPLTTAATSAAQGGAGTTPATTPATTASLVGGGGNAGFVSTISSTYVIPAQTVTVNGVTITNPASTGVSTFVTTIFPTDTDVTDITDVIPTATGILTGVVPTSIIPVSVPVSVPNVIGGGNPSASASASVGATGGVVLGGGNQNIISGILDSTSKNILPTFTLPGVPTTLSTAVAGPVAASLASINSAIAQVTAPFDGQVASLISALQASNTAQASLIADQIRQQEAQADFLVEEGSDIINNIINGVLPISVPTNLVPTVTVPTVTVPAVSVPTVPTATLTIGGVGLGI